MFAKKRSDWINAPKLKHLEENYCAHYLPIPYHASIISKCNYNRNLCRKWLSMNRILVQFTHPALEKSRVHTRLLECIRDIDGVTINDLYQLYPEFDIDIKREQDLLLCHDIIVLQHPFYWYSAPALLKQWQDLVLEHGWAYGRNGNNLKGKRIFNALTSGGGSDVYQLTGRQQCTVHELLKPFERTAVLCQMKYLPPFWVPGSHLMNIPEIEDYSRQYKELLITLRDSVYEEKVLNNCTFLNELKQTMKTVQ
jgi:glutathione-regulated potassium-efflux system ancillary protein KefG